MRSRHRKVICTSGNHCSSQPLNVDEATSATWLQQTSFSPLSWGPMFPLIECLVSPVQSPHLLPGETKPKRYGSTRRHQVIDLFQHGCFKTTHSVVGWNTLNTWSMTRSWGDKVFLSLQFISLERRRNSMLAALWGTVSYMLMLTRQC